MIGTPSHTTGPFFPASFIGALDHDLSIDRLGAPVDGEVIEIAGSVFDCVGDPIVNAILEIWQADPAGRFPGPGDRFKGWGRTWTDRSGEYRVRTVVPGAVAPRAPHIAMMILGSGLMRPLATELFFPGEPANGSDPQLALVHDRIARERMILRPGAEPGRFRFDVRIGGPDETPFLAER